MLPVLLLRPGRNVLGLTRFDYGGLVAVLFLGSGLLARVPTPLALTLGRLRDFDSFFLQSNLSLLCR